MKNLIILILPFIMCCSVYAAEDCRIEYLRSSSDGYISDSLPTQETSKTLTAAQELYAATCDPYCNTLVCNDSYNSGDIYCEGFGCVEFMVYRPDYVCLDGEWSYASFDTGLWMTCPT